MEIIFRLVTPILGICVIYGAFLIATRLHLYKLLAPTRTKLLIFIPVAIVCFIITTIFLIVIQIGTISPYCVQNLVSDSNATNGQLPFITPGSNIISEWENARNPCNLIAKDDSQLKEVFKTI